MALVIELPPHLEHVIRAEAAQKGVAAEELIRNVLEGRLVERNRAAMALLRQWREEPPDGEDATWPEFRAALEADRTSYRKVFSE
jgi:hypothetical protein